MTKDHRHVAGYSVGEEIANSVSHGIGLILAIAGLSVLVAMATVHGTVWHIVSCSIFGAALVLLFASSTVYHSVPHVKAKNVLRAIDHSAIFLAIAGTYTPFLLVPLRGTLGWTLLVLIWGCAILGIILRATHKGGSYKAFLFLYLVMGWAIVAAIKPLIASIATGGLVLLVLGGVFYTVGVIFYASKKIPYNHAIWHGFVLLAAAMHYFSVLFYVIPVAKAARVI